MGNTHSARRAFEAWLHAADHTTMPDSQVGRRKSEVSGGYILLTNPGELDLC